jgi:5'(3')-deoxyribonucleotidase
VRILVDVDGVVADCVTAAGFKHEDITDYYHAGLLEALKTPGIGKRIPLYPGSVLAMERLRAKGHELVFVTAPFDHNPTWMWDRNEWLDWWFPGIPIVHTRHKYLISGDMLVDDNPENLAQFPGAAVLWARPWNEGARGAWVRTDDWQHVTLLAGSLHT